MSASVLPEHWPELLQLADPDIPVNVATSA